MRLTVHNRPALHFYDAAHIQSESFCFNVGNGNGPVTQLWSPLNDYTGSLSAAAAVLLSSCATFKTTDFSLEFFWPTGSVDST